MAVFVVDKLAQALLEKGEDSGVLPGQLGNLVVQIEVGKGDGAGLGITVRVQSRLSGSVRQIPAGRKSSIEVPPWRRLIAEASILSFFPKVKRR